MSGWMAQQWTKPWLSEAQRRSPRSWKESEVTHALGSDGKREDEGEDGEANSGDPARQQCR